MWNDIGASYVVFHLLADTIWFYTLLNMMEKHHTHVHMKKRFWKRWWALSTPQVTEGEKPQTCEVCD